MDSRARPLFGGTEAQETFGAAGRSVTLLWKEYSIGPRQRPGHPREVRTARRDGKF